MIAFFLGCLSSPAQAQSFRDLAKTHAITASDEVRIGSKYIEMTGWLKAEVDDPEMSRRVERITRRVLAASDQPNRLVKVVVIDTDDVNASALPGGFLVVHRGAAELFDDDELAFVLAHEISHVQLRHYATTENLRGATEKLSVAKTAMLASDRMAARTATHELVEMMARHGRQLEYEADLYGLLYGMRAGIPGDAAVRAMKKLEAKVGPIPASMRDMADHPSFPDRIAQLEKGKESIVETHRKFEVGRAAMSAGLYEMAIDAYREHLALFPTSSAAWANLAAAHTEQGLSESDDPWFDRVPVRIRSDQKLRSAGSIHFDRARDACARSIALDPNGAECVVMLGVLARHAGDAESAATFFERAALLTESDDAAVLINQGILAAAAGHDGKAETLWNRADKVEPGSPFVCANRAVLLERQGKSDAAIALWDALLLERRFTEPARAALARLRTAPPPEPEAVAAPKVALGSLELGMEPKAVKGILGAPSTREEDEIGLNVFWLWKETGVSTLFSADAVVGVECWAPCSLDLKGVAVGQSYEAALETLGAPSDLVSDPLFGPDRTAHYDDLGVTLYEMGGTVGRVALWERR